MQKNISAFETLAQIGLVWLTASFFPGFRIPICLKSLRDNTGAESVSNKMFTTTKPLCYFVEILATLATKTGIELDVSHIPGESEQHFTPWNIAWICSTNACLGSLACFGMERLHVMSLHYMSNSYVNYGCYRRRFCARIKRALPIMVAEP
jgi:hypothetical protein